MPDPHRDAFGRLIGPVERLDFHGRVDALRRLQGRLAADSTQEGRWLARALLGLLQGESDDLLGLLDLRPPKGSTVTVAAVVRLAMRDAAVLRGELPCSASTISRARKRRSVTSYPMRRRSG